MQVQPGARKRPHQQNFHLLPGRLRIGLPALLNNQAIAGQVVHQLAQFPGVRLSYANPITGQVLIYFESAKTDLEALLEWFQQAGRIGAPPAPAPQAQPVESRSPRSPSGRSWHALDAGKALQLLGSCEQAGLPDQLVRIRQRTVGPNELIDKPSPTFFQLAIQSTTSFMTKLLLVAGAVSLAIGETADAVVITAIIVVQAVVEAAQRIKAEKSLAALKEFSLPQATVLRDGAVAIVSSRELVPGDILQLEAGDKVPADALIVNSSDLMTDESCLTGESIPVIKERQQTPEDVPVAERGNMLFTGSSIIGGRATAVVVATGMNTELGRIARLLHEVEPEQTGLEKLMDQLGRKITQLVVISVATIAIINLARGRSIWQVIRSGISLAVGAVPEGLPAVLTVALTAGIQRMVKRNAIVRERAAVEALGSTTVICTDKTGTLTKNEMTVKELYVGFKFYTLTGDGYDPDGDIEGYGADWERESALVSRTLRAASLCNNAQLVQNNNKWQVIGDPTEGALLTAAAKAGLCWESLRKKHCRHKEIAFDASRRSMIVVCQEAAGEYDVYVKGAPDTVLDYCTAAIGSPNKQHLNSKLRSQILAANEAMSQKGLRVLAIAYKNLPESTDLDGVDLTEGLIFSGLAGMADPLRPGVPEAIQKCYAAGIKVVMITGDHQKTAEAVAAQLGILNSGYSITGPELETLSEAKLAQKVQQVTVFSRTSPDQKLRIVRALKHHGQIVAMTGDGVNDAPAIKEADIGIAMGHSGTDVAREVAGITLSDDNFVTIVNGIEEGRTVSMNLSKSVRYILSGSVSQVLMVFGAAVFGLPTPLLPAQILWVNLVSESPPAMALTADPPASNYMNCPAINPAQTFEDDKQAIATKGLITGLAGFACYAASLTWGGWSLDKARTNAFSQMVVDRIFALFSERNRDKQDSRTGKNPLLLPAAALSLGTLAAIVYTPALQPLFSTVPLGLKDWVLFLVQSVTTSKIEQLVAAKPKYVSQVPQPSGATS